MDYKTLFELCWGSSLQSKLKCPRLLNYFIISIGAYVGCVEPQHWHYLTNSAKSGFGVQYSASWLINYIVRKTSKIVIKNRSHKRSLITSFQTILAGEAKAAIGKNARLIICAIFYKFAEVKGLVPNQQEQDDLTLLNDADSPSLPLILQIGQLFVNTHNAAWKPQLLVPIKLKAYYKTITDSYSANLDKEYLKFLGDQESPKSFNNQKSSLLVVVGKKRSNECCADEKSDNSRSNNNKRRKIQHDDDDNNNETTIDTDASSSSLSFFPTTSSSTISSGFEQSQDTSAEFKGFLAKANDLIRQAYDYYKDDELDANEKDAAMTTIWHQMKLLFERNIHAEETANRDNNEVNLLEECKQKGINYDDLKYSFDNFVPDEEVETFKTKLEPEMSIHIKYTKDMIDFKSIQAMIDSTFNFFQDDDDDTNFKNMDFVVKPTEQQLLKLTLNQNQNNVSATATTIPHEFQELIYIFD